MNDSSIPSLSILGTSSLEDPYTKKQQQLQESTVSDDDMIMSELSKFETTDKLSRL